MKAYNYAKLSGRIKEMGYTQETLAKAIGISECSLNLTLNNKRDFRQREIIKLGELLNIPANDFPVFFFAHLL